MATFMSPQSDVMFKRIFANPANLEPLRSFLSSVLDVPSADLVTLTLSDTHLHRTHARDKESIVDVRVRTASGRDITVEIQLILKAGFRERLAYYTASMLATQLHTGQPYDEVAQVVTVAVTNFALLDDHGYHHRFSLYDKVHKVELTNLLEVDILELPKLPASSDRTLLWMWLRFLAARDEKELDMAATLDPVIAKAAVEVKFFTEEEERQYAALREKMRQHDQISRDKWVRQEGEREGEARAEARFGTRVEEAERRAEEAENRVAELERQLHEATSQD